MALSVPRDHPSGSWMETGKELWNELICLLANLERRLENVHVLGLTKFVLLSPISKCLMFRGAWDLPECEFSWLCVLGGRLSSTLVQDSTVPVGVQADRIALLGLCCHSLFLLPQAISPSRSWSWQNALTGPSNAEVPWDLSWLRGPRVRHRESGLQTEI